MMILIGSCIDEKCQLEMHHHGALMHAKPVVTESAQGNQEREIRMEDNEIST
jgi:hypothetical protein